MDTKVRVISFYLPQFYPTPENDDWWGPGFTEWTNVARCHPLFKGHYQPRVPGELGFYDLRLPLIREQQAELAKKAGIEGFCYWHYWFGNGKRLLDQVFREVVESGKPDFPFCLCWANHSWSAKTWNPNVPDKMLIEQKYYGEEDYIAHFNEMLPAFKDPRYMKQNGKLIFGIFDPVFFTDFCTFKRIWNELAHKNGLEGFCFFALVQESVNLQRFNLTDYDEIVYDALQDFYKDYQNSFIKSKLRNLRVNHFHKPYVREYADYVKESLTWFKKYPDFIPCIDPDFDHSPRSAHRWIVLNGSTPGLFRDLCDKIKKLVEMPQRQNNLLFVKAWNEWGEGNYLEPDIKWGRGYIEAMNNVFR